jgi:4-hydroxy-tetrahydrodipicolinate synthase
VSGWRPGGVVSVLPTAFHDDGSLDEPGTEALVRAHLAAGVDGVTVLGVMGEAAELAEDERDRVVEAVVRAADGLPVVMGISGATADAVASRARRAGRTGVMAVMVSPAASVSLRDAIEAAAAGGLPIVVQDYPAGSGVVVTPGEIVAAAAGQPLVACVKAEAPPTAGAIAELRRLRPRLAVMGGLGGLFLPDELRAGASGTMTGFALPERLVRIVASFTTAPDKAEADWESLLPLMRFEAFAPFNLAARKEVWRLRGVIRSARCRRAGATLDAEARASVRRAFERVTGGWAGSDDPTQTGVKASAEARA